MPPSLTLLPPLTLLATLILPPPLTLPAPLHQAVITGGWGHYDYPVPVDHPRPIELAGFVLGKICFVLTVCGPLFACGSWGIAFRQVSSPYPDPYPHPSP